VGIVGRSWQLLFEREPRICRADAIFAVDRARLGLKGRLRVVQVLEPVAFDLDDPLQVFLGEREVEAVRSSLVLALA